MEDQKWNDQESEDSVKIKPPRKFNYLYYCFILISLTNGFLNYDNGVIPIILNTIQEPYGFSSTQLGVMGALPYVGTVLFSPLMSYVIVKYNTKRSVILFQFINIISLLVFGLSVKKWMFFVSKFCIGASQALFFTYYPLWIDTFAPKLHRNMWMSIAQGGIIIGMMCGYSVTSLFSYAGNKGWRYSIFTQILCELVLALLLSPVPKHYLNYDISRDEKLDFSICTCDESERSVQNKETSSKSAQNFKEDKGSFVNRARTLEQFASILSFSDLRKPQSIPKAVSNPDASFSDSLHRGCRKCFMNNLKNYRESLEIKKLPPWSKFNLLIREKLFISICLSLSIIYFQGSGFEYWMTQVSVKLFNLKERSVHIIYSFIGFVSPVLGMISGSYLTDKIISSYPDNPVYVDIAVSCWSAMANIFSVTWIIFYNKMSFFISNLVVFFFGASMAPSLTLRSVASLPRRLKPIGSSFNLCQYHILGFVMGSAIPGIAIDVFQSYFGGACILFLASPLGLFSTLLVCYFRWQAVKKERETGTTE